MAEPFWTLFSICRRKYNRKSHVFRHILKYLKPFEALFVVYINGFWSFSSVQEHNITDKSNKRVSEEFITIIVFTNKGSGCRYLWRPWLHNAFRWKWKTFFAFWVSGYMTSGLGPAESATFWNAPTPSPWKRMKIQLFENAATLSLWQLRKQCFWNTVHVHYGLLSEWYFSADGQQQWQHILVIESILVVL